LWRYTNPAIALGVDLSDLLTAEQRSWPPRPHTPAPPDEGWLTDRTERAAAWLAEAGAWPTSGYCEGGAIY
jgi:hypothetical protein